MTVPKAVPAANPFWTFSLDLYRAPEVQRACIDLQDGSGVDVNVMLFLLYLASRGRRVSPAEVARIVSAIEPWKAGVVVPLRTARRNLKAPPAPIDARGAEALRQTVKTAELAAERLQQDALYSHFGPATWPKADPVAPALAAAANLGSYGTVLGRPLAPEPVAAMLSALKTQME